MTPPALHAWHQAIADKNPTALQDLIADDAVFHSPVIHSPQRGKDTTIGYLTAAFHVLLPNNFSYVREVYNDTDAVLEFTAEIDGIQVNGIDMIHWNDDGKITDFKVMLRPLKGIHIVKDLMAKKLEQLMAAAAQ